MAEGETIFALSSGAPPAGIAVIRASGSAVRFGLETLLGRVPPAREATLATLRGRDGAMLDRAIVLFFPGPASFTGEDIAEFHVHGGRAVVSAVLAELAGLPGFRPAVAGEFTRRAFANGRADLTEVEGLADLIAAETEMQRRQALDQAAGALRHLSEEWRRQLIAARAYIEAELDFADEADVPEAMSGEADRVTREVVGAIREHLGAASFSERVRNGFEVVLLGAPNVGKSSLLNALAGREAAIVTAEAGTTRDVIEVAMDIEGYAVTLVDTAGLREADGVVEREGIRRARLRGEAADLLLLLDDGRSDPGDDLGTIGGERVHIRAKADLADRTEAVSGRYDLAVSARSGEGLGKLRRLIAERLGLLAPRHSLVTRERHRIELAAAVDSLDAALGEGVVELKAERLRQAGDALGRLTGRIDVDDWLDVIFREFCIGK